MKSGLLVDHSEAFFALFLDLYLHLHLYLLVRHKRHAYHCIVCLYYTMSTGQTYRKGAWERYMLWLKRAQMEASGGVVVRRSRIIILIHKEAVWIWSFVLLGRGFSPSWNYWSRLESSIVVMKSIMVRISRSIWVVKEARPPLLTYYYLQISRLTSVHAS